MDEKNQLPPQYNSTDHEADIYELWEKSGAFKPNDDLSQNSFTISLPPPNVTGTLHIGHTFEHTLQDTIIRYHRMKGERTLWVPGTDHASIATQARYEKNLAKQKKSRHDFARDEFVAQVQEFALENQERILSQLKLMGDSVDWSRLAFTLDKDREKAVFTAFKQMYDDGLIYRGYRVVNWDPKGQTTLSDDETIHEEQQGKLYTFRYSQDFPIAIATTRPETKLGDVAIAVNPTDHRYHKFIGQTIETDFLGEKLNIKIIADQEVDPNFGTGAVGVTPAHSLIDWEIGQRHDLPIKQVINEYAKICNTSSEFEDLKVGIAREKIVEQLKVANLLEEEKTITNNIVKSERTGGIIEPLPKLQWFVNVSKEFTLKKSTLTKIPTGSQTSLQGIMSSVVKTKEVEIIPEYFEKTYNHWVDNLKDWCISRQILYGHRIPAWYCDCGETTVKIPDSTELIFMRHGEAEHNVAKIGNGDPSIAYMLTEKGIEQTKAAAAKFKKSKTKIDLIIASEMQRVGQTADIIAQELGCEIITEPRLNDVGLGKLEGESIETIHKETNYHQNSAQGSETFSQVQERVEALLRDLQTKYHNKKILLVTSEIIFWALRQTLNPDLKTEEMRHHVKNGETYTFNLGDLTPCPKCHKLITERDSDTFDTWFSSALWTFSTLGWPKKTQDLADFHPTSVINPGYEILTLWVSRMIMMSGYLLGEVPFRKALIHGIVRDKQGRKFSKSLNNGIDPLEVIEKYGTDALRMSMTLGVAPGSDVKFDQDKVKAHKHFANKVWNIARFILMRANNPSSDFAAQTKADEDILNNLTETIKLVTKDLETFQLHLAADRLYQFIWHKLADIYLEAAKPQLEDPNLSSNTQAILLHCLTKSIKLLHPIMPFVTEVIWQKLPQGVKDSDLLISAKWPKIND